MRHLKFEEKHLGTPICVELAIDSPHEEEGVFKAVRDAYAECRRIEAAYSRFLPDNELFALNQQVGEWRTVSSELFALIEHGEEFKRCTEGAFDLTVKSILEGWGYDPQYSFQEKESGRSGYVDLQTGNQVRITAPLELGGLGKGYALDQMAERLASCPNLCINAGGDLVVRGVYDLEQAWKIVFEHPEDIRRGIGYVEVPSSGLALACSSPSRRRWGIRHHLVDPETQEPAKGMLAVYTQAEKALWADAYSTALFVLGFDRARSLLPTLPVEALLVSPEGLAFRSPGFLGVLFSE